jgi:hypothetical protein
MKFLQELLLFNKKLTITEYRLGEMLLIQNERNNGSLTIPINRINLYINDTLKSLKAVI